MTSSQTLDPRLRADFKPEHLPQCDGGDWPAPDSDPTRLDHAWRRALEFAALYYDMNQATAAAEAARAQRQVHEERQALLQLRELSRMRDSLEDRYAPEGFLAEPVMAGSRYINLKFQWSGKPAPVLCAQWLEAEFSP